MDRITQKNLRAAWSGKAVASRAKRSMSSAPRGIVFEQYRRLLRASLAGRTASRVLILGATPELRDLAIRFGSIATAVDISPEMLEKMTEVMAYKKSSRNLMVKADWLGIGRLLQPGAFDAIMGDGSLYNVPAKRHQGLVRDLAQLLKPRGHLIIRHYVYLPDKPKQTLATMQSLYKHGKLDWVWLTVHAGLYSTWQPKLYNPKTKRYDIGKLIRRISKKIARRKFILRPDERRRFSNFAVHAGRVVHHVFPEKEWLRQVEQYFVVKGRFVEAGKVWSEYGAIWLLEKR